MLDSCCGTTFWCVVFIELCLNASPSPTIYCTTDKTVHTHCTCSKVDKVTWSADNEEPAPGPSNMTLELLHYDSKEHNDCIRVLVTWTQKVSHFKSKYVTGYDIEATVGHLNSPKYFECSTNNIASSSAMVSFTFNDTSFFSWCPIPPGEEITYMINARPIYTNGSNPSWIDQSLDTPSEDRLPWENVPFEEVTDSSNVDIQSTTSASYITDSWHFYLTSLGITLALGITLVILTCFVCHKIFKTEVELKRILVICNRNDETSIDVCNNVIKCLKRCSCDNVEIDTNIRETGQVGELGILQWISQKITDTDVVIFIITSPLDYSPLADYAKIDSADYSQVAMAIKAAQSAMLHRSQDHAKFLACYCGKRPDGTFCQCYDINLEQKKFLKQALGLSYKRDRPSKKRVRTKTQETTVASECDREKMLEHSSIVDIPDTCSQNDLNAPGNYTTIYMSSTLNNISSLVNNCNNAESIENNEMMYK